MQIVLVNQSFIQSQLWLVPSGQVLGAGPGAAGNRRRRSQMSDFLAEMSGGCRVSWKNPTSVV
jgi:hypothetical protein